MYGWLVAQVATVAPADCAIAQQRTYRYCTIVKYKVKF
jgi:hypothetical protein